MKHIYIDIDIPEAKSINYSDTEEVCGYQMLLCKLYEASGGFSYPRATTSVIRYLESQGLIWLGQVKDLIEQILANRTTSQTLADIPELLASYDFLYRICHGAPCYEYLRRIRLTTIERWLKGNKTISSTEITLMIAEDMNHDVRGLDGRYLTYYLRTEEQWVNELMQHGKFIDITLREAYERLRSLLKVDLFAYIGSREQTRIKSRWVEAYLLDDPSTLDLPTQWAYIGFIRTATQKGYYTAEDPQSQYIRLFSALAMHPSIHPFYKEAIRIDLEKYASVVTL